MYIPLKDADAYLKNLPIELQTASVKGLRSAALRLQNVITSVLIPSRSPQPVDRGVYRAGWRTVLEADGATVENLTPQAVFIEYGVRAENVKPGRAMIEALTGWVLRHGLAGAAEAPRLAWAIAKAQQKRGIFRNGAGLGIVKELLDVWVERVTREEVLREIEQVFE